MTPTNLVLLRIRPNLPDPDEKNAERGPLMTETALSAVHSLTRKQGKVVLGIGMADGKIGLFCRSTSKAASLVENQMYAQYPEAEIDEAELDLFRAKEGEIVATAELSLAAPDVFPIRRYPQFAEMVSRQSVDTIASITSGLVRYAKPGMRGLVEVALEPMGGAYRKRALKFIPLLLKGLPKMWPAYARFFTHVHMAQGMRRALLLPLDMAMGGWRAWFTQSGAKGGVSLLTGETTMGMMDSAEEEMKKMSARTHEREDNVTGAVDKVNRLLFSVNIRVSVIAPVSCQADAVAKVQEIASSFRQFTLPQCNGFVVRAVRVVPQLP